MLPNPLPRKFTQISEQALAPQQVPLILGHDLFLLTQQDVRKIEDSRLFSLSKLMPNGVLKAINLQDPNECLLLHLLNTENLSNNQNFLHLLEFLNVKRNMDQQYAPCPQPMEVTTTQFGNPTVATIEQQLQWNKCGNTSAPFSLTYSHGTSTTELHEKFLENKNIKTCCCCCNKCQQCDSLKNLCNKSTNTLKLQHEEGENSCEILGAREQLKKKKLNFNFNYIT